MRGALRAGMEAAERGWVPEPLVRLGIRRLVRARRRTRRTGGTARTRKVLERMRAGPIAARPDRPNAQHYEVPRVFFERVLGPRLKYSASWWPAGVESLTLAEEAMLALTAARAGLEDGQRILELGCGWGSFTLWAAERYTNARIVAVSNSTPQRLDIERQAARLGLANVAVETADMNTFEPDGAFDRIVSVEMFEHMRNWERLLDRIAGWLRPEGRLFLHYFSHRGGPYLFEDDGPADWMARHFFTAGLMPSDDLLERLEHPFRVTGSWRVGGTHYRRTAEAWLDRLRAERPAIREIFVDVYGAGEADRWLERWRIFFLAVAELFGFRDGREWGVSHRLLVRDAKRLGTKEAPSGGRGA